MSAGQTTLYGPAGLYLESYTDGRWPLGTRLVLGERVYRFAKNGAVAMAAASLYQAIAAIANHTNVAADVARAAGATVISATLGATAAAVDIYEQGYVHINDAAGEGHLYPIKRAYQSGDAHASVLASGVITVTLEPGVSVKVALTTASEMTFTRNKYRDVIIHPSPPTAVLAGVAPFAVAASAYCWIQTWGPAAVLAQGILEAGKQTMPSRTIDGAVEEFKHLVRTGSTAAADSTSGALLEDAAAAETVIRAMGSAIDTTYDITGPDNLFPVGVCMKANADTEQALIDLNLSP